ncbi:MAG: sensor histidine kinase [Kofleriaceae bacterium]
MRARRLVLQLSPTRLPRELWIVYAVAPLIVAPVLSGRFFERGGGEMLRELAANYIAFATIPAALHLIYRLVMPAVIARCATFARRLVAHLAITALVTAGVALAIYPITVALIDHGPELATWLLRTVTIAWLVILTALVVQELRGRAEAGERRLLEQRQAALRAQLEAIQSRTNPHFLFNSINAVVSLIHDDPALAERTLERLADVLRYALHSSQLEAVPLRDELAMAEDYLAIQRARFGARLRYTIEVAPELGDLQVPPLLLQPLIENAVLHGLSRSATGGQVRLAGVVRDGRLALRVDDDGPGLGGSAHAGSGTGLRDLRHRLALVFGDAGSLVIAPGALGGVAAELVLPVRRAR